MNFTLSSHENDFKMTYSNTHIIKAIGCSQFCTDVIFGTKYNNISKMDGRIGSRKCNNIRFN